LEQEVQWLLAEKVLQARISMAARRAPVVTIRAQSLASFGATLEALRYVGSISEDEAAAWRDRMWEAIGLDPPGPAAPGTVQLVSLADGEHPHSDQQSLVPRYPRRVAATDETIEAFGGSWRIDAIEYDDSVTLIRWRIGPMPDVDAAFPGHAAALASDTVGMDQWAVDHFRTMQRKGLWQVVHRFELRDDVGTEYRDHPISSGGVTGAHMKGVTSFTPGTPSHVRQLHVEWLGASGTFDL
jgi:hypothetical protein